MKGVSRNVSSMLIVGIFIALAAILIIAVAGQFFFKSMMRINIGHRGGEMVEPLGADKDIDEVFVCVDKFPEENSCLPCQPEPSIIGIPNIGAADCNSKQTINIRELADSSQAYYDLVGEIETKEIDVCVITSAPSIDVKVFTDSGIAGSSTISLLTSNYECGTLAFDDSIRPSSIEVRAGLAIDRLNITFHR